MRNTLKAYERLKREQDIDTLFRTGKAFSVFPLKLLYLMVPLAPGQLSPVRVGFSVPKKKFRKSVDRHRIRRLMAEAWRLNKHPLYTAVPPGHQLHIFIIHTHTVEPTQQAVTEAVAALISKFDNG